MSDMEYFTLEVRDSTPTIKCFNSEVRDPTSAIKYSTCLNLA